MSKALGFFIIFSIVAIGWLWITSSINTSSSTPGSLSAAQTIDNSPKVKQLILDRTLREGQDKDTVEYILKTNGLTIDPTRQDYLTDCYGTTVDEIEKTTILPIKDSVYDLFIFGNQNNWTLTQIKK